MIGLGYERSHNRTADRTTPARRSEYVFASAALTLLRIHPKSPRVSRRATTHESLMRMGFFRMPFGCPARGENGAFKSIIYYGSVSFHSKSPCGGIRTTKNETIGSMGLFSHAIRLPHKGREWRV
jgi:hypothetical protein